MNGKNGERDIPKKYPRLPFGKSGFKKRTNTKNVFFFRFLVCEVWVFFCQSLNFSEAALKRLLTKNISWPLNSKERPITY